MDAASLAMLRQLQGGSERILDAALGSDFFPRLDRGAPDATTTEGLTETSAPGRSSGIVTAIAGTVTVRPGEGGETVVSMTGELQFDDYSESGGVFMGGIVTINIEGSLGPLEIRPRFQGSVAGDVAVAGGYRGVLSVDLAVENMMRTGTVTVGGRATTVDLRVVETVGSIAIGDAVERDLGAGDDATYALAVADEERVFLSVYAMSGNPEPVLILTDGAGELIATDNDGGYGFRSLIATTLSPGTCFVTVACPEGSGKVELTAKAVPQMEVGNTTNGFVDTDGSMICELVVTTERWVSVRLDATSGNLDPAVALVDSEGERLAADDDSGGSLNSLITTPVSPGSYLIIFGNVAGSGDFLLSVDEVPQVSVGDVASGSLASGGSGFYQLIVTTAERIEIRLNATSGSLDPALILADSDGAWLALDDDGGSGQNSLIQYPLSPGTYALIPSSMSGSGTFTLSLSVAPPVPQLAVGDVVTGELSDGGSFEYELVLTEERSLVFHLEATSGNPGLIFAFRDARGFRAGMTTSSVKRADLGPGVYTITVSCWAGTSGGYRLSVNVDAS